jgi:hypothetical protein
MTNFNEAGQEVRKLLAQKRNPLRQKGMKYFELRVFGMSGANH